MSKTIKNLLISEGKNLFLLSLATLFLTILIWFPSLLRLQNFYYMDFSQGFANIYRNYDGLEYIVIAKTFYDPVKISHLSQTLPANYYAAHFPGYSLLILLFTPLLGMLKSMLFVSSLFTFLATWAFYFLVRDFKLTSKPLILSLIFLVLPARWLIVHSIGSSEPVFIFFIICALYFFMKFEELHMQKFIWAVAFFGLAAQITRPPGILLFVALGLYLIWKFKQNLFTKIWSYYPLFLIPLGLIGVFYWYSISYGDFWAYFKSGDNIHLLFPPFQVFNSNQFWVGEHWLEDVILVFILGLLGGILLLKEKLIPLGFFVLTYMTASFFVAHRDISRYILPVFPFVLIAFEKVLVSKEFKIVLIILALAIYLYAQNFILNNIAPIPNLKVFN